MPSPKLFALAASLLVLSACQKPPPPVTIAKPADMRTTATFQSYLKSGFPEQDVFVEPFNRSASVVRMEPHVSQDPLAMTKEFARPAYAAETAQPHDPFKTKDLALGPFAKGQPLRFKYVTWQSASGEGTYQVENGSASLKASFNALVPNGTYTVICSRMAKPRIIDGLCGKEMAFQADAKGKAEIDVRFPAPPDTTAQTGALLGIVYHSDRQTHGAQLGDFGKNAHVQLIWPVPSPAEARNAF
jgi:hypothetical protein